MDLLPLETGLRRRLGGCRDTLMDIVYPRRCGGCDGAVETAGMNLCWSCLAQVAVVTAPYCSICGDPADGRVDGAYTCSWCAAARPHFDAARSAARYRGPLKRALQAMKYEGQLHLSGDLAQLIMACAGAHYASRRFDAVVGVPLFAARERSRGYNQAVLLARRVADVLGVPVSRRCLARVRATPSQTSLSARARAMNVKDAFDVRDVGWVEGRRFLLVDDVMTTGATVNECARMLKRAGAAGVWVVTVARG